MSDTTRDPLVAYIEAQRAEARELRAENRDLREQLGEARVLFRLTERDLKASQEMLRFVRSLDDTEET
jgi:hypothetical protein